MNSPYSILKQYWGYESFRPLQLEIIQSVLQSRDTLALLPTGGGKSICFQVPALLTQGLCIVISPLIALMKDQVDSLRKRGITAYALVSGMSKTEVINALQVAAESNCKFLYVSPERLETNLFMEYLPGLGIGLIAVDEAHCISQWGYDFRPPYLRISKLREELRGVPLLALTASATPLVQQDIMRHLTLPSNSGTPAAEWSIFRQSFERKNLSYSVFHVDSRINKILEILNVVAGSSIVYCKTRRRTKKISDLIKMHGVSSDYYHAGLEQGERARKQQEWIQGSIRVMVCTNAFGMGIDKPDVRSVIHADMPDCLENYYQEAGRAGRDGKKAYAVMLKDQQELLELESLTDRRFPSLEEIRKVYQAIGNYLQIPSGLGEGTYFDFDLKDFVNKFHLDARLVASVLKALEQENVLSFSEQIFLPSKVEFIINKTGLHEFEKNYPAYDPVIKVLLRTYEGIYDQPTAIHEKMIAELAGRSEDDVKKSLSFLHQRAIIKYQPRKEDSQLFFFCNRVKAEELNIDMAGYQHRKKLYRQRVGAIISYSGSKACRAKIIGSYFGDNQLSSCGICDNCLNARKTALTPAEFNKIQQHVKASLNAGSVHLSELLCISGLHKEKIERVIQFMKEEEKIHIDERGMISLKRL